MLPGTKIDIDLPAARLDLAYFNGAQLEMNGATSYEYQSIGPKSDTYNVNLQRENNWYYAGLKSVNGVDDNTEANITLLSPQFAADNEAPNISIGQSIRVPVYLTDTVNMTQYVDDVSGIKDIMIDSDLKTDSDGDGIKENDRDSDNVTAIIHK